jgi:hypothetical protein
MSNRGSGFMTARKMAAEFAVIVLGVSAGMRGANWGISPSTLVRMKSRHHSRLERRLGRIGEVDQRRAFA